MRTRGTFGYLIFRESRVLSYLIHLFTYPPHTWSISHVEKPHMTLRDPQWCHIYPVNSPYSWAYHKCMGQNWPWNCFKLLETTETTKTFAAPSIRFIQKRFPRFSKVYYIIYYWLVVWIMNFIFPYIGNFIIPNDFHIFQRGGSTTNQWWLMVIYSD